MDRRTIIKTTGLVAATAISTKTVAKKHHNKHKAHPFAHVLQTSEDCLTKGAICHKHCVDSLISGSNSMKDCIVAVEDMLVACQALHKFAAQKSKFTKSFAKICIKICEECAAACKEHRSHHQECGDCYEACLNCIKACKKLV